MDPPSQSSIDALNTATPDLAHLMADLYIYIYRQCTHTHGKWTPSQSSIDALNAATPDLTHLMADLYIYIDNAHIPMANGPPKSIEHRCLECCYTRLDTSHGRSIYI